MTKKSKRSKTKKHESGIGDEELLAKIVEEKEREALLGSYRSQIDLAARAAVRSAGMFKEAIRMRARLAVVLGDTSLVVAKISSEILDGKYVPGSPQLESTARVFDLAVADTNAVKSSLEYFTAQVNALDVTWKVANRGDKIAAFRALRDVSRGILIDTNEEIRKLWRYVCLAWGRYDNVGPKISLWQPQLDATREEKFKFDEGTKTWKYENEDGSWTTMDVRAAFAAYDRVSKSSTCGKTSESAK